MCRASRPRRPALVLLAALLLAAGCADGNSAGDTVALNVPRGYSDRIELQVDGRVLSFGPFVGYYFKPREPGDLTRLDLVCFNERRHYTLDLPENARLFTGEAVFARLPDVDRRLPSDRRINPLFFPDAPAAWRATRPAPRDEFVHFHSCYDATGPVRAGFWVRHVGEATFTYDMGGRVDEASPLHHRVEPGPDRDFAHIIEFDRGPADRRSD